MKTSPRALQLVSTLNVVFSYIPAIILLNYEYAQHENHNHLHEALKSQPVVQFLT